MLLLTDCSDYDDRVFVRRSDLVKSTSKGDECMLSAEVVLIGSAWLLLPLAID